MRIDWRSIYDSLLHVHFRGVPWEDWVTEGGSAVLSSQLAKFHASSLLSLVRFRQSMLQHISPWLYSGQHAYTAYTVQGTLCCMQHCGMQHAACGMQARAAPERLRRPGLFAQVRWARRFFAPTATAEIMAELRPRFCPHELSLFKAVGLLVWFLPDGTEAALELVPEFFGIMSWVTNCTDWHVLWVRLLSRLARHADPVRASQVFMPHVNAIFSCLLSTFSVPSSKNGVHQPIMLMWPGDCSRFLDGSSGVSTIVKKIARLIVFSFGDMHAECFRQLRRTLEYIRPFFHSSSEGSWTTPLATLIGFLPLNYCKRVGMESGAAPTVRKQWDAAHHLTDAQQLAFVALFEPIVAVCAAAKNSSMVSNAASATKHLAWLHADAVLPGCIDRSLLNIEQVTAGRSTHTLAFVALQRLERPFKPHRCDAALWGGRL